MNITDVNCHVGHWPFRKLPGNTFSDLVNIHKANGITSGYVSSLNSLFYNDPFQGDEELHEIIKDTEYHHVLTINPTLPSFEEDIERGIKLFNISGVKIHPTYHGYNINSPQVSRLCEVLKKHNLPLFLSLRMEDERLSYMFIPTPIQITDLQTFLEVNKDLKIILLNIRFNEIKNISNLIIESSDIFIDTSGLKDQLFNVEKLAEVFGNKKILYGSMYPLFCLKSTLLEVTKAKISTQSKENILFRNTEALNK